MVWSQLGQQAALRQLGLEKTAVRRVPRPDRDVEDKDLSPDVRRDLILSHIQDMRGHQMDPESSYVSDARIGGLAGGGALGALFGVPLGLALSRRAPVRGLLGGAAIGGLAGAGLGVATSGARGRARHRADEREQARVLNLENQPHGIDRELAAQLRKGNERATEEQRQHERNLARLNQTRFNYNVNSGYGYPYYY
jgi:hypothetical protein